MEATAEADRTVRGKYPRFLRACTIFTLKASKGWVFFKHSTQETFRFCTYRVVAMRWISRADKAMFNTYTYDTPV